MGVLTFTMPSGHVVYYRDSDHSYWKGYDPETKKCSARVSGASSIAKNDGDTNSDPLMDWAVRLSCDGVAQVASPLLGYSSVSSIATALQWLHSGEAIRDTLKSQKATWRDVRDAAGDRGSVSHNVLQSLAEGVIPILRSGYDHAVVDWWRKRRPTPVLIEQVVYDHERGFAGRFDLMYGPDDPVLLDLKTSKYLANSFAVQLNLYALACRTAGYTVPRRLAILQVGADGSWHEVAVPVNPGWALAAIETHRIGKEIRSSLRENKKRAESVVTAGPPVESPA